MRKAFILLSAAAVSAATLTMSGAAFAQTRERPERAPVTRESAETRAAEAFARLDANGDGVIGPADREARFAEHFAKADSDGDGQLSLAEASAARETRRGALRERAGAEAPRGREGRRGPRGLAGIVRSADADGDRQISREEFNTAALARFDRADADSDGAITRGERRKAMRGAFPPKRMRLRD